MQNPVALDEHWDFIYQTAENMEKFSQNVLSYIAQQKENPLLQLSEVKEAETLDVVMGKAYKPPASLYFSALREVVSLHAQARIEAADRLVVEKLREHGCNDYKIRKCLTYSPRLQDLKSIEKGHQIEQTIEKASVYAKGAER